MLARLCPARFQKPRTDSGRTGKRKDIRCCIREAYETKILSSVAGVNDQAHTIFTMRQTPVPGKCRKSAIHARLELPIRSTSEDVQSLQLPRLQTTEQSAHVRSRSHY